MSLHIILVLYNQKFSHNSFFGTNKIYVCDNSTNDEIKSYNKNYCIEQNFTYVDMQGNFGLPKAYNEAISLIEKNPQNWILILDQDTELSSDFLEKYETAIKNNPDKKIFAPVIKDSVGIMSPSLKKGMGFAHSQLIDFNKEISNYSFINSGLCVNSMIFETVQYDENMFLDMVDYDFIENVRKKIGTEIFYVIQDLKIYQNFSGVTKNSLQSDIIRFKILIKDQTYYYKKNYNNNVFNKKKLFLRALKLNLQHRTLRFFKLLGEK